MCAKHICIMTCAQFKLYIYICQRDAPTVFVAYIIALIIWSAHAHTAQSAIVERVCSADGVRVCVRECNVSAVCVSVCVPVCECGFVSIAINLAT